MQLRIELLTRQHELAARRFNIRMRDSCAQTDFLLPETISADGDPSTSPRVTKRHYVILSGDEVRGGVLVQDQPAWVGGVMRSVWNIQSPLSEGIVNPAYNSVAPFMMKELTKRNPFIYAIGMGSRARPFPRLLKALGWDVSSVPLFFRVRRARQFLRNLQMLRRDPLVRLAADLAAYSGLGALGIHACHVFMSKRPTPASSYDRVVQFDEWADEAWKAAKTGVSFSVDRTSAVLNLMLPSDLERLFRIRVAFGGAVAGWAALLTASLHAHHHLGNMRLGMIVDATSLPGKERHVVEAAVRALSDDDVDLIVSYQTHKAWQTGLREAGFLSGPSNFLLGLSPQLAATVPTGDARNRIHVNRADGDGLCNL